MPSIIAVDPGSRGYVTEIVYNQSRKLKIKRSYPLVSYRSSSFPDLFLWLSKASTEASIAIIEEPVAVSRGAGHGLLTQGANYGALYAILQVLFRRVEVVHPATWHSDLGIRGKDTKPMSLQIATNLFDKEELIPEGCRVAHDGLVDSVLLGYYAYLNFVEKN